MTTPLPRETGVPTLPAGWAELIANCDEVRHRMPGLAVSRPPLPSQRAPRPMGRRTGPVTIPARAAELVEDLAPFGD